MKVTLKLVLSIFTAFLIIFVDCAGYNGPIAGKKSISECITGSKSQLSELEIIPSEFIRKQGYPAEDHLVLTEDGYLLTLTRIPGRANASAVLLHHGFPATAFDWVVLGKNKALAFLLADEGYDVWLGNTRGGLYSRCHVKYTTSQYKFWNFSFHEMALYDLPAEINYIQKISGNVDMYYVGHSMGSTISYILAVENPELASKFKILIGLAPIAFMKHARGTLPLLAPFAGIVDPFIHFLANGEVFQQTLPRVITLDFCTLSRVTEPICLFFPFTAFGFDFKNVDYDIIPIFLAHGFVPSAYKIAVHFAQLINSGKFQKYDYGILGNRRAYHSITPPEYDLSKVRVPVGLIYAENDLLSTSQDVKDLQSKLPTVNLYHKVEDPKFNHLDFIISKTTPELVNAKVISAIKSIQNGVMKHDTRIINTSNTQ